MISSSAGHLLTTTYMDFIHLKRFIYIFLFQMSSLQIFQWHAFGVTDHPVNPLSTAHRSVNDCIAGHFFFQTKCNIMHTFWSSAQHDDFPSLILWLFQKMLQCCWFLGVSCVICGAIKSNGIYFGLTITSSMLEESFTITSSSELLKTSMWTPSCEC